MFKNLSWAGRFFQQSYILMYPAIAKVTEELKQLEELGQRLAMVAGKQLIEASDPARLRLGFAKRAQKLF